MGESLSFNVSTVGSAADAAGDARASPDTEAQQTRTKTKNETLYPPLPSDHRHFPTALPLFYGFQSTPSPVGHLRSTSSPIGIRSTSSPWSRFLWSGQGLKHAEPAGREVR